MRAQRGRRAYAWGAAIIIALLLAAQFLSLRTLRAAASELAAARSDRDTAAFDMRMRVKLASKYRAMESAARASGWEDRIYPENANALYAAVNAAFKMHRLEHTNLSSSSHTAPGGVLELRLNFSGPYYGLLNALAAIRESRHLMKIADLTVEAASEGAVTGTVTILSIAARN